MKSAVTVLLKILGCVLLVAVGALALMLYDGLTDSPGTANCVVVFASPGATDVQPGSSLAQQLDEAAQLYQSKTVTQIIVTGGDATPGSDGKAIIDAMSGYLTAHGVPASQVMADSNATTLDASAQDVADYLKQSGSRSIMIVAPYYEVSRNKLALEHAGVGDVMHRHAGALRAQDFVPAVQALRETGLRVARDDVEPQARKLAAQAQAQVQDVTHSFSSETSNDATPRATATPAAPGASGSGSASDSPAAPPSPASPGAPAFAGDVTPLTGGQTVTATGIASLEIPMDWSQRVVFPILDPVWAPPGCRAAFQPASSSSRFINPDRCRKSRRKPRTNCAASMEVSPRWDEARSRRGPGPRGSAWSRR